MKKYILELKNRFFLLLFSYFFFLITVCFYKDLLLHMFLITPKKLSNESNFSYFILTDVTEIFNVYLKLIFFFSFQTILFMLFYHFILFISPGLFKVEFKYLKFSFVFFTLITFFSFLIAYFIIIPLSWGFFLSFHESLTNKSFTIYFEAKLIEYFNFYISFYYLCNLYFQLFVLLFFILNYIHNNYNYFKKFRKIFYFCFVFFSSLICPELFSQITISLIFIFIYEVFLFVFVLKVYAGSQLKLTKTDAVINK